MRIARDIITCMAKPLACSPARSLTHPLTLSLSLRMRWVGWTVRWFPVPSYWTPPLARPAVDLLDAVPADRGRQRRRR